MVPCNCAECQKSDAPHFFKNELLNRYRQKGIRAIRCEKSLEDVDVQRLINDVFLPPPRERFGEEDELGLRDELLRQGSLHINTLGGSVILGNANVGGNFTGGSEIHHNP